MSKIDMYRVGNTLLINSNDGRIVEILKPVLSFTEKKMHQGYAATVRKRQGLNPMEFVHHTLYRMDQHGRPYTYFGFWKEVTATLKRAGYQVACHDNTEVNKGAVYTPQWSAIEHLNLRTNQPEFIDRLTRSRCGRFDCPPGFGKSFLISVIAQLYSQARIDVVSKNVAVLRDSIYKGLLNAGVDVGCVGGGVQAKNHRVMCYTMASMKHADYKADILIGDECHQLAADSAFMYLPNWTDSRNFGLSATQDQRFDGKDARVHAIFGPLVYSLSYAQAQKDNMVTPIRVKWTEVTKGPKYASYDNSVSSKRNCYWRNAERNRIIANDARQIDMNRQSLITVETIEHAMNLKKYLPEYALVYAEDSLTKADIAGYAQEGCCSVDEPPMDAERKQALTAAFEAGHLKKAIATGVWNLGVSFHHLFELLRADGSASSINGVQIGGRLSRLEENKSVSVLRDYIDAYCPDCYRRSRERSNTYDEQAWSQEFPEKYAGGL